MLLFEQLNFCNIFIDAKTDVETPKAHSEIIKLVFFRNLISSNSSVLGCGTIQSNEKNSIVRWLDKSFSRLNKGWKFKLHQDKHEWAVNERHREKRDICPLWAAALFALALGCCRKIISTEKLGKFALPRPRFEIFINYLASVFLVDHFNVSHHFVRELFHCRKNLISFPIEFRAIHLSQYINIYYCIALWLPA